MEVGSKKRRNQIVLGVVLVLVAANILRWWGSGAPASGSGPTAGILQTSKLPELLVQDDFLPASDPVRDLFQPHRAVAVVVEEPAPIAIVPAARPDPMVALRERANAWLDGVEIEGIISTTGDPVAMLRFDGAAVLLKVGDELIPGYTITGISTTQLRVVNETLNIQRLYSIGETVQE